MADPFWTNVDNQLDHIERVKPNTAWHLIEIMNEYSSPSSAKAFFEGSGGDRQLLTSVLESGWRVIKYEATYYWVARHPDTGDVISYVEGDVYDKDVMPDTEEES